MNVPPPLPPPKRPVFVWVISGYYLFGIIMEGLSMWLMNAGLMQFIPLTPQQQTYFHSMNWVDYGWTAILMTLKLWGTIELFLLRRTTMYPLSLCLLGSVAYIIFQIVARNYLQAMPPTSFGGVLFGWAMAAAVIVYAANLAKKGVLR